MESRSTRPASKSIAIIGWLAMAWNLLGLVAILMQLTMSQDALAQLPEEQQTLISQMPGWVKLAAVTAVVFGTLGSLGLALRRRWAVPTLALSLAGVVGQQTWMRFLSNTFEVMGPGSSILPTAVLVISVGLFALAIYAARQK